MIELAIAAAATCGVLPERRGSIYDRAGRYAGRVVCEGTEIAIHGPDDRLIARVARKGRSIVVKSPDGRITLQIR